MKLTLEEPQLIVYGFDKPETVRVLPVCPKPEADIVVRPKSSVSVKAPLLPVENLAMFPFVSSIKLGSVDVTSPLPVPPIGGNV